MGLDIYAGTLTRYYSRNWKNIVQQISEENGMKCVMTGRDGKEIEPIEDKAEIDEIRDFIYQWANKFTTGIDQPLPSPLWDENNECGYFTDKPGWEAYGALAVVQACILLNKPLPKYAKIGWNPFKEPVVEKAMSKNFVNSLLSDVTFWLPIPVKAVCETLSPTGVENKISTVELLRHELEEINRSLWQADEPTILSWRNDKYYNPVKKKPTLFSRFFRRTNKKEEEVYYTEELAQCAYSMLYQAVNFATENKVPIVLDY